MKRVDFNANTEVKYLANWKIVQTHLAKHKVDKSLSIDKLAKCKMQDNLEFLQWCKKYWDQYFPGGDYDAAGRRGGMVPSNQSLSNSVSSHSAPPIRTTSTSTTASAATSTRRPVASAAPSLKNRSQPRVPSSAQTQALQNEVAALTETVMGLEKERDFYFNKLRDIEILIQTASDADAAGSDGIPAADTTTEESRVLMKQIQEVLYSTEEGFEVPQTDEDGLDVEAIDDGVAHVHVQDDDEVF